MASSRRSRPGKRRVSTDLLAVVSDALRGIVRSGDHVAVALSGGVDSVVLLDLLKRIAARRRLCLSAIHVNHQISPNAKRWAAFCRRLCRERGIALKVVKTTVPRGNSLEAAARAARYDVFANLRVDIIALAHNQDDQAETVLLQLLRGAGVKGLAAMPVERKAGGMAGRLDPDGGARMASVAATATILRPLLGVPRSEIEAYARARRLNWIEDESNDDIYFVRNFLRHEVLPLIARRFPAYRVTLARAASNFAAATRVLEEMAAMDGASGGMERGTLSVDALRRLPVARAQNLLRHFLSLRGVAMPSARRLDEAFRQVLNAKRDASVLVGFGGTTLRRFDGCLYLVPPGGDLPKAFTRRWQGEADLPLPELSGVLSMKKCRGSGISLAKLGAGAVTIRLRQGKERLQADCRRPRRSLKNLLQEFRMPPWERDRLPLLFCGEDLVWVPGIGIAASYQARKGEAAIRPVWTIMPRSG